MKDNLEKAFKESLDSYEVPYDAKAWDAMNAKLDAKAATSSGGFASVFKWGLALVLTSAVVTGSYFLWFENQEVVIQHSEVAKIEETVQEENKKASNKNGESEKTATQTETIDENLTEVEVKETPIVITTEEKNKIGIDTQSESDSEIKESTDDKKTGEADVNGNNPNVVEPTPTKYVVGDISASLICQGESLRINNTSSNDIVRFTISDKTMTLNPNESVAVSPQESMNISFVNVKNEVIGEQFVTVIDLPTPDFKMEANIFEKGMPVVIAEAYGDYKSYSWEFDGKAVKNGANVKHNFFEKGDYDVVLKVTDVNGCEAVSNKSVRIRDKFNLMAVDAFKPNGTDLRNRTFMPYSLTERDVRFMLTIVDPIDNGVVFSSSDAENTWDGTDQRTGKLTESNKPFIWKVQIFNPAPNERPIYAGTVVHN